MEPRSNTPPRGSPRHGAAKIEGPAEAADPATGDKWFGRACASEEALRHIGIIAFAASIAITENASRKGTSADFEITEAALDTATAFLRAIEDIVAQARRAA